MNGEKFRIRQATADDLSDIQHCALSAYEKYVETIGQKPAPMTADFGSQIKLGQVHVAVVASVVAGYVVFYCEANQIHLENVAVIPALMGQGIGKKLIEYVEQSARDEGLNTVELYTNEAMRDNIAMYPKLGYIEIERKKQDGFSRVFFRKTV